MGACVIPLLYVQLLLYFGYLGAYSLAIIIPFILHFSVYVLFF